MESERAERIFRRNQTSAHLLMEYARSAYLGDDEHASSLRFLMVYDLYVKAFSYAWLNKVFFFVSLITGVLVLAWPTVVVMTKDQFADVGFLGSAVVQTSITGLSALSFAVYGHYKRRQMFVENLMRKIVYSKNESIEALAEHVVAEMVRIDEGFSFSNAVKIERNAQA